MSSLSWPSVGGTAINTSIGTLAGVGTGAYTIVALTNPQAADGGIISFKVTSSFDIEIIGDTSAWFGANDFTSGYTGHYTVGDWQIIGQSKAAGTNVYRWHWWNYTTNSAKDHADGTGTHANPGAITAVAIGDADVRGRGFIAAIAVWKRVLSDAEFNSLCTTNLSDWMAVSGGAPDAIWALNVAAASVVDGTGNGANESSVSGTISLTGTDPPSFNYSLAGAPAATAGARPLPPQLVQQLAAIRAAQFPDSSAVSTPATVSPSTVAAVATVGAPTLQTGQTVTAVKVSATATVGAPTVLTGEAVAPATVAAVATVGAPTVQTGETVTATTVAAVATVGSVTFTSAASVAPATVAATATVGAPTVQAGETVAPATVAAVATVGAPALRTGETVTAATVAAVATVGTVTVTAGGNVTITASTVAGGATVGAPTVTTGAGVSPATVAAVATVGAPTIRLSVVISPTSVTAVATVGAATAGAGSTVAPATVAIVAAVGAPTIRLGVLIGPATVAAIAAVGAVTINPSVTVAAVTVPIGATVPHPTVSAITAVPLPDAVHVSTGPVAHVAATPLVHVGGP